MSTTDALVALHRAGWSIGDLECRTPGGGRAWLVTGTNGENVVRAMGPTAAEAYRLAVDQARGLGMLGGPRPPRGPEV